MRLFASFVLGSALCAPPSRAAEEGAGRQRVLGIGGFFFRSKSPQALQAWYLRHLGVNLPPRSMSDEPWTQEAGPTNLEAFPENDAYFDLRKPFMINFRVKDLDAIAKQLRADGIEVAVDPNEYPNGRFAHLKDLEGNPIQLWQFTLSPRKAPR